jgi:hypothetical protein
MAIEKEDCLAIFHLWIFPCHELAPSRLRNESTVVKMPYNFRPARGRQILKVCVQKELKGGGALHLGVRKIIRPIRGLSCRRKN